MKEIGDDQSQSHQGTAHREPEPREGEVHFDVLGRQNLEILVALSAAAADREAAIARLRTQTVSKPNLIPIVKAIAKVLAAKS